MVVMVVAEWEKITSLFCLENVLRPGQFDASGMVKLPLFLYATLLTSFRYDFIGHYCGVQCILDPTESK